MTSLSICIPTFNRTNYLDNCLNSIKLAKKNFKFKIDVCVSDNNQNNLNTQTVNKYKKFFKINYHKNRKNIGRSLNMLKAVSLSKSDFIWLIGDDDLVLPNSILNIKKVLERNRIDFLYVNSYSMNIKPIKLEKKFNMKKILKNPSKKKFSKFNKNKNLAFYQLIDPKISFDFLGGMYLSVFRRKMWENNKNVLIKKKIKDLNEYSSLDNTFPHLKIFAKTFMRSKAFFLKEPLSVNFLGVREWEALWPLVQSIRIIEVLEYYRKCGLPLYNYINCKNFALRNFFCDYIKILLNIKDFPISIVQMISIFFKNIFYPNLYLSFFSCIGRKLKFL